VRGHEKVNWLSGFPCLAGGFWSRARGNRPAICGGSSSCLAPKRGVAARRDQAGADPETTLEIFAELGRYDWLVFTSANGVRHFFDLFLKGFRDLRALGVMRIACVGEATARLVRALHLEVELCPEGGTAEELAEAMITSGSLDHARCCDYRQSQPGHAGQETRNGGGDRRHLSGLRKRPDRPGRKLRGGRFPAVRGGCGAVRQFVGRAGVCRAAGLLQPPPGKASVAGSSPRTSEAMRKAGNPGVEFEAKESNIDAWSTPWSSDLTPIDRVDMIKRHPIQVCGLTSLVDAELADRAGADYLGFNLYAKSPRSVTLKPVSRDGPAPAWRPESSGDRGPTLAK